MWHLPSALQHHALDSNHSRTFNVNCGIRKHHYAPRISSSSSIIILIIRVFIILCHNFPTSRRLVPYPSFSWLWGSHYLVFQVIVFVRSLLLRFSLLWGRCSSLFSLVMLLFPHPQPILVLVMATEVRTQELHCYGEALTLLLASMLGLPALRLGSPQEPHH